MKRYLISGLVVLVAWFSVLAEPTQVLAGGAVARVDPLEVILDEKNNVEDRVGKAILAAGLGGLVNAVSFFMRKLAYDTATFVASGGKGQGALAFQDGFDKYLEQTAGDAFGEIVASFSDLTKLNLCQIPDPQFNLNLVIGIRSIYEDGPPTARGCSWTEFRNGWNREAFEARFESIGNRAEQTLDNLVTGEFLRTSVVEQSDFGITMDAMFRVDQHVRREREAAKADREEGNGFKGVTDLISGDIKTPANVIQEETKSLTANKQGDVTAGQIAGVYGAAAEQIIPVTISVFLNTLTSQLLGQLMSGGLIPSGGGGGAAAAIAGDAFAGPANDRRAAANQAFSFLQTAVPTKDLNAYDGELVRQFATCPDNPGVYNCVIDTGLQQAIERGYTGDPVTIQEALDAQPPMLFAERALIPPDRPQTNEDPDCYRNFYCHSNIQKLRKARILPLGFEIAATLGDPDVPSAVTLGEVVAGYNDCAIDEDGNEFRDLDHPYCHLIDPNWIIKIPEAVCEAVVHSPVLQSPQIPNRQQECADLATCVAYNSNGQCVSYGYCLQEENSWQMPGQSCPSYYNTCRTYVQQTTNQAVSYLDRTVDFGMCNEDNVGCLAYSLFDEGSEDGENWRASVNFDNASKASASLNQTVYFNSRIAHPDYVCNPDDAGCTHLEVANIIVDSGVVSSSFPSGQFINLQLAPDYLTCYDKDQDVTNGIDWPTTVAEVVTIQASDAACGEYAPACIANEVGCHLWTPENGGSAIPGKVGANTCDPVCKGYDTFRQRETIFEPAIDELHFIPSLGDTCQAQYEGCSEFTNIGSPEQGGERLEYFTQIRYCEVPTDTNEKTFYTWEGSASEGFVLRVHQLAQYASGDSDATYYQNTFEDADLEEELFAVGAPKYAARTKTALEELYNDCNEATYNLRIEDPFADGAAPPTCREFIDDNGAVYYRQIDQIVSVSNQCLDYRKTETTLSVDDDLTEETNVSLAVGGDNICTVRGGLWQDSTGDDTAECNVCRGGGEYRDGTCVYAAIKAESVSCPAAANQCRSYVGNTGENIRIIELGTFENDNLEGWTGGNVSTESPFRDQGSLRVTNSASRELTPAQLRTEAIDSGYELRFWARGVAQQVSADLEGEAFGTVSIGDIWREYRLGPIAASDLDQFSTSTLTIGGSGVQFFIDNIEIVRTNAYSYLIKDSWKQVVTYNGQTIETNVPLVCDSTPLDAFPGEALGCEQYTNQNGTVETITSFESLCREDAIGCTAVYDTQNTDYEGETWYNARCSRDSSYTLTIAGYTLPGVTVDTDGTCTVNIYAEVVTDTSEPIQTESCTIRPEDDYCYIEEINVPIHGFVHRDNVAVGDENEYVGYYSVLVNNSRSTFVVDADTPDSEPIFVANQPEYRCTDAAIGCTAVGKQSQVLPDPDRVESYEFATEYYRIGDLAAGRLDQMFTGEERVICSEDGVGCDAFQSEGSVQYFKDPKVTGNTVCDYRSNVLIDGERRSGWFKRGVGTCNDANANLCTADDDCAAGVTCNTNASVACYEDYINLDNEYGIWSNNTEDKYLGFVGTCTEQYHMCSEFVDRAATSRTSPDGDKYYAIFNDQLTERVGECDGQVGLKDGCVLFDQTSNPNKVFNTQASYLASATNTEEQYGLVEAVDTGVCSHDGSTCNTNLDCGGANTCVGLDANIVLKVNRDRQCAEWLQCRLSRPETDENGRTEDVCLFYDVCIQADESGACEVWADTVGAGYCSQDITLNCADDTDCTVEGEDYGSCVFQQTLTVDRYANRDTSWYGRDYSGYSLMNTKPYSNFEAVYFDADPYSQYLAYRIPQRVFDDAGEFGISKSCRPDADTIKFDMDICGLADEGRCYEGRCIAPINSRMPAELTALEDSDGNGTISEEEKDEEGNRAKYQLAMAALTGNSCKAYPEQDSPYPASVLSLGVEDDFSVEVGGIPRFKHELASRKSDFVRANVYQDPSLGDGAGTLLYEADENPFISSCVYTKVVYRSGQTDYYPINKPKPRGLCGATATANKIGNPCSSDTDCTEGTESRPNSCNMLKEKRTNIGMDGFCLQKDLGTPINGGTDYACLVWLPMQTSASRIDVYNNHLEAGYYPVDKFDAPYASIPGADEDIPDISVSGGQLYCLESTNFAQGFATEEYVEHVADSISFPLNKTATIDTGGSFFRIERADGSVHNYKNLDGGIDLKTYSQDLYVADAQRIAAYREDVDGEDSPYEYCGCNPALFYDLTIMTRYALNPALPYAADATVSPYTQACEGYVSALEGQLASVAADLGGIAADDGSFDLSNTSTEYIATVAYPDGLSCPSLGSGVSLLLSGDSLEELETAVRTFTDDYNYDFLAFDGGGSGKSACTDQYFSAGGGPRLACSGSLSWGDKKRAEERASCNSEERIGVRRGRFQEIVCSRTDSSGTYMGYADFEGALYTLVQTWAWDFITKTDSDVSTAQVLRVEYAGPTGGSRYDGDYGQNFVDEFVSLFPAVDGNERRGGGTDGTGPYIYSQNYHYAPKGKRFDWYNGEESGTANRMLFSTGLEENLNENMIRKVHILPLRIPNGHSGNAPALMTDDFLIDFNLVYGNNESTGVTNCCDGERPSIEFPSTKGKGGTNHYYRETLPGEGARYVALWIGEKIESSYTAPTKQQFREGNVPSDKDPFDGLECGSEDNWFALGMHFDNDGRFLGYESAQCIPGDAHGLQVAIVAELYDSCIDVAQVYDEDNLYQESATNRAYTNRVWREANDAFWPTALKLDTDAQPGGSLPGVALEDVEREGWYAFREEVEGTPLKCNLQAINNALEFPMSNYSARFTSAGTVCEGLPGGTPQLTGSTVEISDYFADVFNIDGSDTYKDNASGLLPPQIYATNPETCKTRSLGAIAAQVASAPTSSFGDDGTLQNIGVCIAGPGNTFTVNGMTGSVTYDADRDGIPDEDTNQDGVWDGMIGYSTVPVTVQFFAYADHNRMPIRSVSVDFGDGPSSEAGGEVGYYKNAKPVCGQVVGECGSSQLTCTSDQDCVDAGVGGSCITGEANFGNQGRACTQNYFEYNYVYRCYDGQGTRLVSSLPDGLRQRALRFPNITEETRVCAFKPKVTVQDNWDWCNAANPDGDYDCNSSDLGTYFGSSDVDDNYQIFVVPKVGG